MINGVEENSISHFFAKFINVRTENIMRQIRNKIEIGIVRTSVIYDKSLKTLSKAGEDWKRLWRLDLARWDVINLTFLPQICF